MTRMRTTRNFTDDGYGIFETLVVLMLGAIVLVAATLTISLVFTSSRTAETNLVASSAAGVILGSLQQEVGNAEPLGHCATDLPINGSVSYTTGPSSCAHIGSTGTAVAAIGSAGFCFYAQAPGPRQIAAPAYVCIVEDTSAGNLYLIHYPPVTGDTYTTCDPSSAAASPCWGGPVSAMLSTCEANPTDANCWLAARAPSGSTQQLLGHIVIAASSFAYLDSSAVPIPAPAVNPNVSFINVTFAVPVSFSTHNYVLNAGLAVNGSAFASQQNWDAP
jgi:hypothetical protein